MNSIDELCEYTFFSYSNDRNVLAHDLARKTDYFKDYYFGFEAVKILQYFTFLNSWTLSGPSEQKVKFFQRTKLRTSIDQYHCQKLAGWMKACCCISLHISQKHLTC